MKKEALLKSAQAEFSLAEATLKEKQDELDAVKILSETAKGEKQVSFRIINQTIISQLF